MNNENKEININTTSEEKVSPQRKREIIKTLLIIFLAALLVLTFFSNTIMNRSLAEISTETAVSGKLTERVRGSGLVESNQAYEVSVEGTKTIKTIEIKTGQEVKKGDVLFTVSAVEDETLELEEKTLSDLELEYQKALLTEPTDYTQEDQAIRNAREDLNRAIAERNAAAANESSAAAARDDYNSDKRALADKTEVQTRLRTAVSAIDSDDYSEASPEYTGSLVSLFNSWMDAAAESEKADEEAKKAEESGADAESAKAAAAEKRDAADRARSDYENEKNRIRNDLMGQLGSVESEIGDISFRISDYESQFGSSGSASSYDAADADVIAKQRTLEDLITTYNKTKRTDDLTNQKAALDLEAQQKAIEKQRKKVEKLKKDSSDDKIKSKYSGVVSAINVKPDEKAMEGTPIAVIDIIDEGFTVKIPVEAEKTKKIKKGCEAEVVNNWGGEIEAVLTDIKNDTVSGSKNRILVFSVKGDVESGTNLDLSIPCGSGQYDALIPKSAVYEDNKGKFVLTVRSKNSPLGNRYYAERVNVDVKASDEATSAVEGDISQGTYVITNASKPVSAGDQVRIKDK